MNSNGTRPPTVHDLHLHAQRCAERDGKPRWVVTMDYQLRIVQPRDFVVKTDHRGQHQNWIERVAYPYSWHYRRRR